MSELAWLVARDDAQRQLRRRVWLDPDLHVGQAPLGWIQVCTAAEVIRLLDEFVVHELSLPPGASYGGTQSPRGAGCELLSGAVSRCFTSC